MLWHAYLLAFLPPVASETAAPISGAEIIQFVVGAFNLGTLGWVSWVFFTGKLHSDSEMERARTDLAAAVESARADLARSVEAARADLLRENERLITERDDALKVAQTLVPMLASFTATVDGLLPLLQDIVRAEERQRRHRE